MKKKIMAMLLAAAMTAMPTASVAAADGNTATVQADVSRMRASKIYYVTADVLAVRSGPGTNYSIIGSLTYGQAINVTSINGGWAKFRYADRTGYVSAACLRLQ